MKTLLLTIFVLLTACQTISTANAPHNLDEQQAQNYFNSYKYQEASDAFLELAKKSGQDIYILKAADSAKLARNCKRALELYEEIEPKFIEAKEGKLACFLQDSNFHDAEMVGKKLLAIDATRWKTLNALGVISALAGKGKEAIDYFKLALELIDKDQYIVQNNMALAFALQDKLKESIKLLEGLDENEIKQNHQKIIAMNLSLFYGLDGQLYKANEILSKYLTTEEVDANLAYYTSLTSNKKDKERYIAGKLLGK